MVPSIDDSPPIRAVFGQYGRHDPRHIPSTSPTCRRAQAAADGRGGWLLRIRHDRCRLSTSAPCSTCPPSSPLRDLAGWAATAHRVDARRRRHWGLDASPRGLNLRACGEQNNALFGLRRMLMGYAAGRSEVTMDAPFTRHQAYDEVGLSRQPRRRPRAAWSGA